MAFLSTLLNPLGALANYGAKKAVSYFKPPTTSTRQPQTSASLGAPVSLNSLMQSGASGAISFSSSTSPLTTAFRAQPKPAITSGGSYSAPSTPYSPPKSSGSASVPPLPPMEAVAGGSGGKSQNSGSGSAPAMPVGIDPRYEKDYNKAMQAYQKALELSPEELSTQGELDRVIESFRQGYTGIKNKAIPMEFITGQLSSLEERAVNLAEPLENKLARMQAQRLASLESSKFSLEQAGKRWDVARDEVSELRREANEERRFSTEMGFKERELAEGTRRWDSEFLLSKDKFEEDKKQFGMQYALDTQKFALEAQKEAREAAKDAVAGQPSAYKQERATRINDSINDLLPRVGYGTTGAFGFGAGYVPGTKAADFRADLNKLAASIAFNELAEMREASKTGGALGSVAVRELELLQDSLGSLSRTQSPENLRKNLLAIQQSVSRWNSASGSGSGNVITAPDGTQVIITD